MCDAIEIVLEEGKWFVVVDDSPIVPNEEKKVQWGSEEVTVHRENSTLHGPFATEAEATEFAASIRRMSP